MKTAISVQYDCCVIINCIRQTGDQLKHHSVYDELSSLLENNSIQAVCKEAETIEVFLEVLNEIYEAVVRGVRIWIHIFSHGNENGFLFNRSNSLLSWGKMAEYFYKINKAMNFKLFLNLTCCKGINIQKMQEVIPDSFFELISTPYDLEIKEAACFNAQFYQRFLTGRKIEDIITEINCTMVENKMNPIQYIVNTQKTTL